MFDYVIYIDTDSLFININEFIKKNIGLKEWNEFHYDKKIEYILKISKVINDYVNEKVYDEVQLKEYNSQVFDFKIEFKQEIVARSVLFSKKKKYALWTVNKEGISCDKVSVTGLDIIRSDTSERVREMLNDIMEMILKDTDKQSIRQKIDKYKKELVSSYPEEISVNIGVNTASKYLVEDNGYYKSIKGAPFAVKGIAAHNNLLKRMNLKYEKVKGSGEKVKVVYLKKNVFGFDSFAFYRWYPEFDKYIQIDYNKMIETFFVHKIKMLLEPASMLELLETQDISSFFS